MTARVLPAALADLRPRSRWPADTVAQLDRLGYADCPVCGFYTGLLHRTSTKMWELWLTRVRQPQRADPVSGYAETAIREHLAAARAASAS